jgi:putative ABC transport system permease protein
MGVAVRYRYVAGLCRGWRSWAVLALVSGLAAGLVLTAIADARRTTSALPRAMRGARAADAQVSGDATKAGGAAANAYADAVSQLPDVTAATRVAAFFMARITPEGGIDAGLMSGHALGFVRIAEEGEPLNQARVVQGRQAAGDRPEEMTINRVLADTAGWRVGQVVEDVRLFGPAEMTAETEPDAAKGTPVRLRVVGLVEPIDDVLAGRESIPRAFLSPAFLHRHPDSLGYLVENVALRDGADGVDRFRSEVAEVAAAHDFQPMITSSRDGLRDARSLLRPQIVAIWLLGLVLLAVVTLLAGQAIGRQVQLHEPDLPELRALGMTRSQRRGLGLLHGLTVAVGAAAVAVATAAVLSVGTPLGSARAYEWDRGFRLDVPAMTIGAIVVVLLLTASSAVSAGRVARRAEAVPGTASPSGGADRPSRAVELAAGAGAPPAFVVGMRMALQPGRGRTAAPVRSVMTSIALAVALVVATAGFAVDLQRLVSTPPLYGVGWDAAVGTTFGRIPDEAVSLLAEQPGVAATAGLALGSLTIDGRDVPAWGVDLVRGTIFPTIERGRLPQSTSEVVLGRATSQRLGLPVGATVAADTPTGSQALTVVGIATFPQLGLERYRETSLGEGAATVASLMGPGDGMGRYNYALVRYGETVERAAAITRLRAWTAENGCSDASCVLTDLRPRVLGSYARLRGIWVPALLALAVLLVMTLAHGLVTSVRARRHDLAILGALGLSRRQTRHAIVWEALTLSGCALLVGIPIGIAGASLAWLAFTRSLGISPGGAVPGVALVVLVGTVAVLAALIGAMCSVEATRTRRAAGGLVPALELR